MRPCIVACAAALLLTGCNSTPIEELTYSQTKALAAELHKRCAEQGAPPGSPDFDACMRQELTREQAIRYRNRERRRAFADALGAMGESMQRSAAMRPRPTHCTTTFGGTWVGTVSHATTSCY